MTIMNLIKSISGTCIVWKIANKTVAAARAGGKESPNSRARAEAATAAFKALSTVRVDWDIVHFLCKVRPK